MAQPAADHALVDLAEVGGVLQVAALGQRRQAWHLAVVAALHTLAHHKHHIGGAVVGAQAHIFRHAAAELREHHHHHVVGAADALQVQHEGRHGIRGVGQQALMQIVLEHMRVKRIVVVGHVEHLRRHARGQQGHHFRQVETGDAVVHGRFVLRPGLAHQGRGVAGAAGNVLHEALRVVGDRRRVVHGGQRVFFLEEGLAHEALRVIEHHGHMAQAAHGKGLPRGDVHQIIRGRVRRHGVGQTAHPAIFLAAVGRRSVPVGHGREVGVGRVFVAAAVHDGQLAFLVQALEAGHAGVQPEVIVKNAQAVLRQPDAGPRAVIGVVGIGHHGVEAVIAAREFQNDEDLAVGRRLCRHVLGGAGQRGGQHAKARQAKTGEAAFHEGAAGEGGAVQAWVHGGAPVLFLWLARHAARAVT